MQKTALRSDTKDTYSVCWVWYNSCRMRLFYIVQFMTPISHEILVIFKMISIYTYAIVDQETL